jgi:KipI family sensor histidine kinase inhibitor
MASPSSAIPRATIDRLAPDFLRVELRPDPGTDPADTAPIASLAARLGALPGVLDAHHTRHVLGVRLHPAAPDFAGVEAAVRALLDAPAPPAEHPAPRTIHLPVRFTPADAPDLEHIASHASLTPDAVIDLLLAADLRVEFLGFMPGFPYMSGLPAPLHLPRRSSPRPRVPAGSLALAGSMCGVYPVASPGGWHLVGRTPTILFDATRPDPATLRAGDRVRLFREGSAPCPSA